MLDLPKYMAHSWRHIWETGFDGVEEDERTENANGKGLEAKKDRGERGHDRIDIVMQNPGVKMLMFS